MYILYLTKYSNSNRLYTKSIICVYRNHLTSLPNIFIIKHKPADTCECAKMLVSRHWQTLLWSVPPLLDPLHRTPRARWSASSARPPRAPPTCSSWLDSWHQPLINVNMKLNRKSFYTQFIIPPNIMIIIYLNSMITFRENSLVKELKENVNKGRNIVIFTYKSLNCIIK